MTKEVRLYHVRKTVSSTNDDGKTVQVHVNTKHKNKLKMDYRPNMRPDTIKLLEENIGRTL